MNCPKCGAALQGGRFCVNCGTPTSGESGACPSCGSAAPDGARFCLACGRPLGRSAPNVNRLPIILGGLVAVSLLAALFASERKARPESAPVAGADPSTATAAGTPLGTPPDISTMTPRERFDRLYNRVMEASENGDAATVTQFTPMALAAYGMLDQFDADARYHAAMLRLHTDDPTGASALADTILADNPSHLLGLVIRGDVARFRGDEAALAAAQKAFAAGYDAEMAAGRTEYREHQRIIDRFRDERRGGGAVP